MPKPKSRSQKTPKHHHLDKRADLLAIAPEASGQDEDLLTSFEVSQWLRVSSQWLEIGRHKNYGPKYERLGPGVIRYRRDAVRAWLAEREFSHTAQYKEKASS